MLPKNTTTLHWIILINMTNNCRGMQIVNSLIDSWYSQHPLSFTRGDEVNAKELLIVYK